MKELFFTIENVENKKFERKEKMENIIQTHNLTKRYGKHTALNQVNIHVRKGEIYGLIGKNGAGKTTFFRALMGMIPNYSGTVSMYGKASSRELEEGRRNIGFMMGANFFPYLTARQNLEYFRKLKGIADENEVERVLSLVEMEEVKKPFKSFSMGMKQRISIANALMGNPDIVILDEPINGLDPQGIADFRRIVQKLNQERKITFIVSSHILGELGLMATRFGFIHNGALVEEIDREEIRKKTQEQVIVKVDDIERATFLLEEKYSSLQYHVNGEQELVLLDMIDHTHEVADLLVTNQLKLYKLSAVERSLEEYFLELINHEGGEAHA